MSEINHLFNLSNNNQFRVLVRAGATGARAPAEIWQRVQGTRPDKGAILVNSKKSTPKLKVNHLSKINSIE